MSRVVVGMSGGVDSSVAAYLLKEQGYEVIGVTMQVWQEEAREFQEENGGCCGLSAVEDARRVAARLDIPYYVMNFREEFQEHVIDYFTEEYLRGRTPNPCIACNRFVNGKRCSPGACLSGRIILPPGITQEWHSFRTADIPSGARPHRQRIRPMRCTT